MEHGHGSVIHLKKPQEAAPHEHAAPLSPARPQIARTERSWRVPLMLACALVLGVALGYALHPAPRAAIVDTYAPPAGTKPAPHTETDIVKAVGNLIQLPEEAPSVATVTDLAPLREQAFFAEAEVGDVVLMFPQSRKALLYRPSENKLIEAAPLSLTE